MSEHGSIVNPSSVGNPAETPIVQLSPEAARLFNRCEHPSVASGHDDGKCGGVNGFHAADCEATAAREKRHCSCGHLVLHHDEQGCEHGCSCSMVRHR